MKLTYRGISYDYLPGPAPKFGDAIAVAHYRGNAYAIRNIAEVPAQPAFNLMWRGVPYRSGSTPAIAPQVAPEVAPQAVPEATPQVVPEPALAMAAPAPTPAPMNATFQPKMDVVDRARALFIRHHQMMRRREQAMMVRLDAEVGLDTKDAARYESRIQGKIPHDFGGYDRSHAAMS
jgi:hypothetical protein